MKEAETSLCFVGQAGPIAARGLEQRVGANDVCLDETARTCNRTVDMAFSGQTGEPMKPAPPVTRIRIRYQLSLSKLGSSLSRGNRSSFSERTIEPVSIGHLIPRSGSFHTTPAS